MHSRTRIKICGITRVEDGLAAAEAGADALGLVFYAPSPRNVDLPKAVEIAAALPVFVATVALFVDADSALVESVIATVAPNLLQFHGDETPEECARWHQPFVKAIRVRPETNANDLLECEADFAEHPVAGRWFRGLLLDAWHPGLAGGTGESFNWNVVPRGWRRPYVLSGGLTPDNVGQAVRALRPWAVDVSSGVEVRKGIKDAARMAAFIRGVRDADERGCGELSASR